ncbi:DOMON domain-containing protein Y73F4A.2 [Caenorhabditis elegans]|uniref:DOMON domain-containing protein Y73F4A.2 n=1 Tax=Caenorhabditis elegans TaxID=6239 RepID=DMON1_CAEEL|nr:DOMON domain-containing protein Y73F4A.2 [Caenorhabditis elegans]Q9XWC3.1 RecName: Full=DOMON domain-containing protein Y73F4A.2; Flags: Precursor [Caenorhabditis elegans]CAA21754.1 DOMON domain-containing protein Y73F4A.2 [Caenorhabditis elegans]|eukprot:NP_501573.1 DOMON domain-containing protein Y73F4A.2 [Caenorhabditis elegans]
MFRSIAVLSALLFAFASAKTCKYDSSDFEVYWRFANNSINMQFMNTDIKNNEWTGVGFGDDKNNFVGVFFMVSNNQVTVRTGSTTQHGPPTFTQSGTNTASVSTQALNYFPEDKTMSAVVQIPIQFNGRSLQSCQKWRFVKSGKIENGQLTRNDKSPKEKKVCPMECN